MRKEKEIKNVELTQGKCAVCGGSIDEKWAGKNPALGTKCRECSWKKGDKPEPKVFGPENAQLNVTKKIIFNPLTGEYGYHFDFSGSQIMINGKIGTISSVQSDMAWADFEDRSYEPIKELGYWDLLRIYQETGFNINPPPLDLPECEHKKVALLENPIMPLLIEGRDTSEGQIVNVVYVGDEYSTLAKKIPFMETLHAFANLYTMYKLGLAPNFCFEGGFLGNNFEVRNMMGAVGITISMGSAVINNMSTMTKLEATIIAEVLKNRVYQQEQERPGVIKKDATANQMLTVWCGIMVTLLRYDWTKEKANTVEDVWRCYCLMQNVLLNVIPQEEIDKALDFARDHKIVQYGRSY